MLNVLWLITGSFLVTLLILASNGISTLSGLKIGINQVSTLESKSGVILKNNLIIGNTKFTNNVPLLAKKSSYASSRTFLQNFVRISGRLESNLRIQLTQLVRGYAIIYCDIGKQSCLTADLDGSNSLRANGVRLYQ